MLVMIKVHRLYNNYIKYNMYNYIHQIFPINEFWNTINYICMLEGYTDLLAIDDASVRVLAHILVMKYTHNTV